MTQSRRLYKLSYLPLFWEDLSSAVSYIAHDLSNPNAARKLVDDIERGIMAHVGNPTMAPTYHTTRHRSHPYHYFKVGNYLVFYVVLDDTIEIRRMLYRARDLDSLIL